MLQWCHIDSECPFISNNLNRIHSHLKWPIMSNDSECATSQISGLSDPFGARSMWFTRSCRLAWNAAVKPSLSWGSFTTASPDLKWWISWGKSGRTSMKERVKSWGKGDEKTWETLNIWKKTGKRGGKFWGNNTCVSHDFPCFVPIP